MASTVTVIDPPFGVNFTALDNRFRAICFRARLSAETSTGSPGRTLDRLTPLSSALTRTSAMAAETTSRASNRSSVRA